MIKNNPFSNMGYKKNIALILLFFFFNTDFAPASEIVEEKGPYYQQSSQTVIKGRETPGLLKELVDDSITAINHGSIFALKGFSQGFGEQLIEHTEIACHNLLLKSGGKLGELFGDAATEPIAYLIAFILNNTPSYPYLPDSYIYYLSKALKCNGIVSNSINSLIDTFVKDSSWNEKCKKVGTDVIDLMAGIFILKICDKLDGKDKDKKEEGRLNSEIVKEAAKSLVKAGVKGVTKGYFPQAVSVYKKP